MHHATVPNHNKALSTHPPTQVTTFTQYFLKKVPLLKRHQNLAYNTKCYSTTQNTTFWYGLRKQNPNLGPILSPKASFAGP